MAPPPRTEPVAELVAELERSSEALTAALGRRDPCYLEHLESRSQALFQLAASIDACENPEGASQALERLRRLRQSCSEAEAAARGIRSETQRQILDLDRQRKLARALGEGSLGQYATLDVKA
jgi:hypothetical protein